MLSMLLCEMLAQATKPLILVGGGGWSASTAATLTAFAERHSIPVCSSFRCQDYMDNRSPAYVGHTGIAISAALAEQIETVADELVLVEESMQRHDEDLASLQAKLDEAKDEALLDYIARREREIPAADALNQEY